MAPSRHDWKIVDWDVKPQHNQPIYIYILIAIALDETSIFVAVHMSMKISHVI